MSEYREGLDWFALGYRDAYDRGVWWAGAESLDDEDFLAYSEGFATGSIEWEADNR